MARGAGRGALAAAAVVVVALAAAVAVVLLGRGGADEPGQTAPDLAPLTGLPVDSEADLDRPAVAIKLSDVQQAHPQVGVTEADIVFVQPVGVSYTRLAAVFHTTLPDRVGPVRSVRPADAPLLGPLAPVFGNTMGAEWVLDYVDEVADLDNLGSLRVRGSGAYVIDEARPEPDHVFADPQVLLELSDRTDPPAPYFSYAEEGQPSSAELTGDQGDEVVVSYGPGWDVAWTYDETAGRYLREQPWGPHTTADGEQVSADNVLVLEVASEVAKLREGSGAPVPVLELIDGSGEFTAFADGRSVTGTWTKGDVNAGFELRTDAGDALLLAPGNTWVELPSP